MKHKLNIIQHYDEKDKGCGGDYVGVTVLFDGKEVTRYGDFYDERGKERADGFVDACVFLLGKKNVIIKRNRMANARHGIW